MKARKDPYLREPNQKVTLHGISFPLELLYRGALIVGQPGSGKTAGVLMPLMRSILEATGTDPEEKAGMMCVDPKNEYGDFIRKLLRELGREDDLVVLSPGTSFYNPLDSPFLTESETIEKIIGFANHTNRNGAGRGREVEAYWENALRSMLTCVVAATRTIKKGKISFADINATFRKINKFQNAAAAMEWCKENALSDTTTEGIRDFLNLPESSTRPCVATSVSGVLYFWESEPLKTMVTPQQNLPAIDPFDILHRGKILHVACSGAAFGVSISPLLVALKEEIFATLLSRDQIEVQAPGGTWALINQKRPFFILADEFQSYVTPSASVGELVALDRLRAFKAGYIAATQTLASLHSVLGDDAHATRLISLFSNQVFMANICPYSARQASHILGQTTKRHVQKEIGNRMAPPMLFRAKVRKQMPSAMASSVTTSRVPRVDSTKLAAMQTGEFYMRLANGTVHHKRATLTFERLYRESQIMRSE